MALIKCAECETEVSDKAEKCPKCACPISLKRTDEVQTIEKTSKHLKKQQLIGSAILIIGFIIWFTAGLNGWAILFLVVGILSVMSAKALVWWNHE